MSLTPEQQERLTTVLEWHMTERDFDQGCSLACGYDGDERDAHLAKALAPVVAQMLADERERIARAIEALPEHDGAGWPNRAYEIKEDAARIAREATQ